MQSEENNIDDFFNRKYNEFDAGTAGKATHWLQMNDLLDGKPPGNHKPVLRKRITRRIIRYLGLVAVVTTIVYFFVTSEPPGKIIATSKKESVTKPAQPPVKGNLTVTQGSQSEKITPGSKKNYPMKVKRWNKSLAVTNKNKISRKTILKEISDTALQNNLTNFFINRIGVVRNFYDHIKPATQSFTIDPNRDTLLVGASGTVLTIPAHSFCDGENKMVKTALKLELIECYKYPDMLSYDLTTTVENEQLVTGGMLKISATANWEDLKLVPYKTLGIKIPMEKYDPEMQLFTPAKEKGRMPFDNTSDRGDIAGPQYILPYKDDFVPLDWQPAGQQQIYKNLERYFERKNIKLFDLRQMIKGEKGKYNVHFLIRGNDMISDDKIKDLLRKKYQDQPDKITVERVKEFPEEAIAKNTNVLVTKIGFVAADSVEMNFQQALKERLVSHEDSINFAKQVNKERRQFIEKIKNDSIAYVRQKEFDKTYNFDITGLGWINCDRIYKSDLPTIEFSIDIGNDIDQVYGNYKMVFTNFKSVLPGTFENGKVSFGKIPLNEPVQLVCVAQRKGKAVACIKSMKVTAGDIGALRFEEMSPAVFKEKISVL